ECVAKVLMTCGMVAMGLTRPTSTMNRSKCECRTFAIPLPHAPVARSLVRDWSPLVDPDRDPPVTSRMRSGAHQEAQPGCQHNAGPKAQDEKPLVERHRQVLSQDPLYMG